jgi:hypothetical protein
MDIVGYSSIKALILYKNSSIINDTTAAGSGEFVWCIGKLPMVKTDIAPIDELLGLAYHFSQHSSPSSSEPGSDSVGFWLFCNGRNVRYTLCSWSFVIILWWGEKQ